MKIPGRVAEFHEFVMVTASSIIAAGKEHDPLMFLDGGPEGSMVIDLRPVMSHPGSKPRAAELMREVAVSQEADFAAIVIEAWLSQVDPGDDLDIPPEDRPGAQECLVVQVEIKGEGLWYWSHKITADDAGTRVLDTEGGLVDNFKPDFHRFVMFPADPTPLN